MIVATFYRYNLKFKNPSGTSRGILRIKETFFLVLTHQQKQGIGECALFRGLSADDTPDYEDKLRWVCEHIHFGLDKLMLNLVEFPSIQFGLEQAFLSLESKTKFDLFPSKFILGEQTILINGLIWMGDVAFMKKQIKEKLKEGFLTLKMKIGAIDFENEIALLSSIRKEFSANEIALRVDANGAFSPTDALKKMQKLADLKIHSIEQPIKKGQIKEMAYLCKKTPLPIALDEELIGIFSSEEKRDLIEAIKPQYIILKPSLLGGFVKVKEWMAIVEKNHCGWWITSALESNIGLNAIAQFTFGLNNNMPQGLGTGGLFTNNFESPLGVREGALYYDNNKKWNVSLPNFENA